ncbi:DUF3558 domain-containing protein [Nocardia blacklockiae]|nr:DUF3558 domain-containing protein [Nocardia blacklockiae]
MAAGTILLLSACNSGDDPQPSANSNPSASRIAPAPTAFDPCSGVLQPVLDSEQLHNQQVANSDSNGGIQWRGCQWVQSDGYSVSIRTTNITLQMVRENTGFQVVEELSIGGRAAVVYRDPEITATARECALNFELQGGSLEFSLSNPASNRKTGNMDTCEIAKGLAEKTVPLVPASV